MITTLILLSLVSIFIGSMSAAWRRACVDTAKGFITILQMEGHGTRKLDQATVNYVTPRWVGVRNNIAVMMFILSAFLAGVVFRWYWGIAWFLGLFILSELGGFIFPRADSAYYKRHLHQDFTQRLDSALKLNGSEAIVEHLQILKEITQDD